MNDDIIWLSIYALGLITSVGIILKGISKWKKLSLHFHYHYYLLYLLLLMQKQKSAGIDTKPTLAILPTKLPCVAFIVATKENKW